MSGPFRLHENWPRTVQSWKLSEGDHVLSTEPYASFFTQAPSICGEGAMEGWIWQMHLVDGCTIYPSWLQKPYLLTLQFMKKIGHRYSGKVKPVRACNLLSASPQGQGRGVSSYTLFSDPQEKVSLFCFETPSSPVAISSVYCPDPYLVPTVLGITPFPC